MRQRRDMRATVKEKSGVTLNLAKAPAVLEHHGEDARFVLSYQQRDVAVDGYLCLDELLGGGVDVAGVGEGEVLADLFDYCDAGG